jgi:hypothetical protein
MSNKQKQHAINYSYPIEEKVFYDTVISDINKIDINKSNYQVQPSTNYQVQPSTNYQK